MYIEDNDEGYPPPSSTVMVEDPALPQSCNPVPLPVNWGDLLYPYTKSDQIFRCPSSGQQVEAIAPNLIKLADSCPPPPPVGGGGGHTGIGGGGGGGNSCPPTTIKPKVRFYSYAINALDDDDVWWEHSPGLPAGRHEFGAKGTSKDCSINKTLTSIRSPEVATPERSIYAVDAQPWDSSNDIKTPALISDGQLPYVASSNDGIIHTSAGDIKPADLPERVGSRHMGGFVALFADGHVKWQNSNAKSSLWTVEDD